MLRTDTLWDRWGKYTSVPSPIYKDMSVLELKYLVVNYQHKRCPCVDHGSPRPLEAPGRYLPSITCNSSSPLICFLNQDASLIALRNVARMRLLLVPLLPGLPVFPQKPGN